MKNYMKKNEKRIDDIFIEVKTPSMFFLLK